MHARGGLAFENRHQLPGRGGDALLWRIHRRLRGRDRVNLRPLASYVPKALLAGLLIVAASRLFDIERLRYILGGSRYDAVLLIATAFSAIAINIEFAILIGTAISIAWYVTRASKLKAAELIVTPERVVRARVASDPASQGVLIYDIEGELFFGAAPDFERYLEKGAQEAERQGIKYIVLRLKRVRNPDVVALEVLDIFLKDARRLV